MNTRRAALWVLVGLVAVMGADAFVEGFPADWGYDRFITVREGVGGALRGLTVDFDEASAFTARREGTLTGTLGAGRALAVNNEFGSVRLRGLDGVEGGSAQAGPGGPNTVLRYRVTVYARTQEAAEAYLPQVQVRLLPVGSGGDLSVTVQRPRAPAEVRRVKVEIEGTLPADGRVELQNGFGQVVVENVGGPSRVTNRFGPVELFRLRGDWAVEAPFGSVTARGVTGSMTIKGDFGDASVAAVRGDVHVEGNYGQQQLVDIDGDVQVTAGFGDVRIDGARRNVDVDARYGDVTVRLVGPLNHRFDVEARHGRIDAPPGLPGSPPVTRGDSTERWSAVTGDGRYRVRVRAEFGHVDVGVTDAGQAGSAR